MTTTKPFSAPCERNRDPILAVLRTVLQSPVRVLEIGSGTGQHAVHFGAHLPYLQWQTSDLVENHDGIRAWLSEAKLLNVLPPIPIDMADAEWSTPLVDFGFSVVYTANTCHIMSWPQVQSMVNGIARLLPPGGLLCIYGPFNYGGLPTSDGNAQFDAALREAGSHRAIRDAEALQVLARANGLHQQDDHPMPANNRLMIFQRGVTGD